MVQSKNRVKKLEKMASESSQTDEKVERTNTNKIINLEEGSLKTRKIELKLAQKLFFKLPSLFEIKQYVAVCISVLCLWGTLWFLLKELVLPGGYMFDMAALVITGYVFGHTLGRCTTINPVVGMTLVGVLYKTYSSSNFLLNPSADKIDFHLRRIYPVIILTKGSLTWSWKYIKNNSVKVFTLATLPWIAECLSTAFFTHIVLGFPWYWGLHLGAITASVSPAVIVPTTIGLNAKGFGVKNQIALLVANAGGLDTAFTEGIFGVINSSIFYQSSLVYRIVKGGLAIFVGIGLGVTWGVLIDVLPDRNDFYAPIIRSLLIFAGGLLFSYGSAYFGWGGTSGVAIMVCAGAASTRWSRHNWLIDNNPVAEVYTLLWRIFEPMLFTLSGYFFEVSLITLKDFGIIVGCIFAALSVRMLTAFLVAMVNQLSLKESIFIAITWMPKAIVEAVLVRVATDSLWVEGASPKDIWIAKQHSNIIVIAILITSTLGSVLTTVLGPILLSNDAKIKPQDDQPPQAPETQRCPEFKNTNNILESLQYIDSQ